MSLGLTVPPIYSPFPAAIHPNHEAVDARTSSWADSFGIGSEELRKKLVEHDIGKFAARILPAGDEQVVQILADFVMWLFGVDDGHCEEGELGRRPGELAGILSQYLRIAQNPEVRMLLDDPLAAGLRDLSRRISDRAAPAQATRWVDGLREYFLSVVWEASYRTQNTVPNINDYTLMRLYDGATSVVMPLLEMAHGYELEPAERDRTEVRAVAEMAYFLLCWDNDIFSFHKESRGKDYYLNVIRVMEHEWGLSTEQALAEAIAQRDRVTCLFLRQRDALQAGAGPRLRQYLTSTTDFIRAFQDWGISSVRYTCPDDPAALPSVFRDTPTDDSLEPLPIPAVAWWWELRPDGASGAANGRPEDRMQAPKGR